MARGGTRGGAGASILVVGLAALLMLGLLPSLAAGGAARAPGAPAPGAVSASGPAPSVAPFRPAPTTAQQLASVPPVVPHVSLGAFGQDGPHPASWGAAGVPPGWEALAARAAGWGGGGGSVSGYGSGALNSRVCAGLWPQFDNISGLSSQGAYAPGCYGADEPGIEFQSDLPGSGGNVTWNLTLPTDRDATHNQSDLYSAVWFGLTLNDPYGWMDQCFLELQFYPDQSYYNPGPSLPNWTVNGQWVAAAVAWQIQASNGYEDPCFYEPMYLNGVPGPAFLNMTQGDRIEVVLNGYATSPTGERVSILDRTSGKGSNITMYNPYQGYPVDPAYVQNDFEGSLQWTPGGEYPVSFAFEVGHADSPQYPSNNSVGGCSPGGPTSTPSTPSSPCPSYDPSSWANDTLAPWQIDPPTFYNAHATQRPAQVAFTQPEGGIPFVNELSNGICSPIDGSAWCSYPFYSYYCASHSFGFGGVDYSGVSSDFGKWNEFSQATSTFSYGSGFYDPTNFSLPSCGKGVSVGVGPSAAGGGSVYFLSTAYAAPTSVAGLSRGTYSLDALPAPGRTFAHWTASGGVAVAIATSPYTTLNVFGPGNVSAVFTTTPSTTSVAFHDYGAGTVGLDPDFLWLGNDSGLATLKDGQSYALAPGIYSIQAYPKPGWNFSYWSFRGGVSIAATQFPYTQLLVTGQTTTASVVAWYTSTTALGTVVLYTVGEGSASFGHLGVHNANPFTYNAGYATMRAGSYAITLKPGPGVTSWQILYGPPLLISNNSERTVGTLEAGTAVLEVIFSSSARVTFHVSPGHAGTIYAEGATGFSALAQGSNQSLGLGLSYGLAAVPSRGFAFTGWSTSRPSALSFAPATSLTDLTVLGAGGVTANFVRTPTAANLTLVTGPSHRAGLVQLDLGPVYGSGTTVTGVTAGEHLVTVDPAPGWSFAGWKATGAAAIVGPVSALTTVISLGRGAGTVTATFVRTTVPLSFTLWNPRGTAPTGGYLAVDGVRLFNGETVWLRPGSYPATLHAPGALQSWEGLGGIGARPNTSATLTVVVTSGGTLEAVLR